MARIKVLLLQDVPELGLAGDIYAVAGGYARNYLIPRQYAILASKGALKQAEEIREAGIRRRAQMREDAEAQASVINGKRLLFQANAGEGGRLYGSVTASDIAEQLEEKVGFEIDRRRLMLGQSLRDLGIYEIELRLMPEVSGQFHVAVVREEEGWADAEAREAAKLEAAAEAEAAAAIVEAEDIDDELEVVAEIAVEEEEASEE
jgi:large subunit ribosomal protein L9